MVEHLVELMLDEELGGEAGYEEPYQTEESDDADKGDDSLDGGIGDDTLAAAAGDDSLYGGPGQDKLKASGGNDLVEGGPGVDSLYGYAGDDTYEVARETT